MRKFLITPPSALPLYLLPMVLWLAHWSPYVLDPYFEAINKQSNYSDGAAMAIGIGYVGSVFIVPFILGILFLILRNYPGCVSLFAWNYQNNVVSILWTVLFGWFIGILFGEAERMFSLKLLLNASLYIGYIYLCFAFRSTLVEKSRLTCRETIDAVFPVNDPDYLICPSCKFEQWRGYRQCQKCRERLDKERW